MVSPNQNLVKPAKIEKKSYKQNENLWIWFYLNNYHMILVWKKGHQIMGYIK